MKYQNIREEELKNKVGVDFFTAFDTTKIVGNVDFCVTTTSPLGRAWEGLVNASLYDIRDYFQGRNDKGKMNNKSEDEIYMQHIKALRESLKILAKKIEPKVY